jgi:sulfoquinovosidase
LRKALDLGFTGWMADYGEWLPPDAVLASGEDALKAHNRYADNWMILNREVLNERTDGKPRLFFARSGWFRSNEITPVVWAGDQRTDFEPDDGLPTVIPLGVNLGLSGISTFGHDVAGYQSSTNPPSTKELFFRWTTLGALSPVMRTHHGTVPQLNWRLDKDADTLAHYKRWAQFHTALLPYFEGHAAQATATGVPIMRAMALAFPEDDNSWTNSSQYMLGGALLVAPILSANATSRSVHFPAGAWISFDGKQKFEGPSDAMVNAPLSEIPIFVRAGSVVPLLHPSVETFLPAAKPTVDLGAVKNYRKVLVYVGGSGSFGERDGTTYSLRATEGTMFADEGVEAPACGDAEARGCVDSSGPHRVLRLKGNGPAEVPGGVLRVVGVDRPVDVEVIAVP